MFASQVKRNLLRQTTKPVNAPHVLLVLIRFQTFRALLLSPSEKLAALAFIFQQWNSIPAGHRHSLEIHYDDRPGAGVRGETGRQISKARTMRFEHASTAVQSDDVGRTLEGTEHQHNPPVLFCVRDCLYTAADQVKVGDCPGIENAERVEALWREIDVPVGCGRRGRDKKDMLLPDKFRQFLVDF